MVVSFVELGMGVGSGVGAGFEEFVIGDEGEHEYALWEFEAINNNE